MRQDTAPAQYLQIALDIAARIDRGELAEGARLYGRSLLSSEYGVSPETIRRAFRLLADMKVIEVKPQSGATVLSADSARRYLQNFSGFSDTRALREQLRQIMEEYSQLNQRLSQVASALVRSQETFSFSAEPLPNFEVIVPEDSPLIGRSIGSLKFWQATGATIVAIRRGQAAILSPGPYAELYGRDILVLVGAASAAEAARRFLSQE